LATGHKKWAQSERRMALCRSQIGKTVLQAAEDEREEENTCSVATWNVVQPLTQKTLKVVFPYLWHSLGECGPYERKKPKRSGQNRRYPRFPLPAKGLRSKACRQGRVPYREVIFWRVRVTLPEGQKRPIEPRGSSFPSIARVQGGRTADRKVD